MSVERRIVVNDSAELLDRKLKSKSTIQMQMLAMIRTLALSPCSCVDKKLLKNIENVVASIPLPKQI